jgi:hypothetical protein
MKVINLFLMLLMLLMLIDVVYSNYEPDFGKMMDVKREEIKELRRNNIPIDRRIRYSDKYKVKK